MKKILGVLVALCLMTGICQTAFAAPRRLTNIVDYVFSVSDPSGGSVSVDASMTLNKNMSSRVVLRVKDTSTGIVRTYTKNGTTQMVTLYRDVTVAANKVYELEATFTAGVDDLSETITVYT